MNRCDIFFAYNFPFLMGSPFSIKIQISCEPNKFSNMYKNSKTAPKIVKIIYQINKSHSVDCLNSLRYKLEKKLKTKIVELKLLF